MRAGTRKLSKDHQKYLSYMQDVWQRRDDVHAEAKALYCCLLTYEDLKTNRCIVCQGTLSRHLRISIASVRRRTRELEKANLCRTQILWYDSKRHVEYTLYAAIPSNDSGRTPEKPTEKIVPFPSLSSTGCIPSTTRRHHGSSGSNS